MIKLEVLGASLALALLIVSPAAADTVRFGGASVENEFLFFGGLNNGFLD